MRNLLKTFKFTFRLLYRSSRLLVLLYLLLNLLSATLPLASAYILKEILNRLTSEGAVLEDLLLFIGGYITLLVAVQAAQSSMSLCNTLIMRKAEKQYSLDVSNTLNELPLSFIDTKSGKDLIDDVNHLKMAVTNFPNYAIQTISALAAFIISFSAIAVFHLGFSILFLLLTVPGLLFQFHFRKKADQLRRRTAPDVRKFSYYRWVLTDPWPAKDVRMYDLTEPMQERYPESGCIKLDGVDLKDYNVYAVRRLFGVLFQDYVTYCLPLREIIALSDFKERFNEEKLQKACLISGASEIIKDWEDGFNSVLGRYYADNGKDLSGGQWQLVGLARAYFKESDSMILDEPSAALDPISEDRIFEQLYHLSEGKGSITISHRLSNTTLADKILVIGDGHIIEQGSHCDLLRQNGEYARLFNLQASKYV